jgi:hypothetical protein
MKIQKCKKIIYFIKSFNQIHDNKAIRSAYHPTPEATPEAKPEATPATCQLVFGRDMIQNDAFRANWDQIPK